MKFNLFIFFLLLTCSGCSFFLPNPPCPPPPSARPPITPTFSCNNLTVPPVIPDCCQVLGLCELVDLALLNSPKTRAAWYRAKQAATDLGAARGEYLPPIFFKGSWLREQFPDCCPERIFCDRKNTTIATFSTSYLLFDFGGRNANIKEALWALDSLCWSYNWDIQSVMLLVIQSYYNYLNLCATVAADIATVEDNSALLRAAQTLKSAGVMDISDELQAETQLIQSQIVLEQDRGSLNVTKATLIQSLGLPPDTCLQVSQIPEYFEFEGVCQDMATLMQIAKERRADLKAMRSFVMENRYFIKSARSQMLPTVTTDLMVGEKTVNQRNFVEIFSAQFSLNVPVFNSFADINELRLAQAKLLESQANLDDAELSAFLSVLSDYYELVANGHILKYSKKYLEIATKNREIAYANYQAGVTTIVDVMAANQALSIARVQLVDAKTNFLASLANLAYHTGGLKMSDIECDNVLIPKE